LLDRISPIRAESFDDEVGSIFFHFKIENVIAVSFDEAQVFGHEFSQD
jgi:hypothetical protein